MTVAFIVDGQTEKKIVQCICPNSVVRMTQLNGCDVAVSALVKRFVSFIKLFKDRYYPIIIVCDREGRDITAEELEKRILDGLIQSEIPINNIIVSVPDRMIENWIIADKEYMVETIGVADYNVEDGENGKSIIKLMYDGLGLSYHELAVGASLFPKLKASRISVRSPSFGRLAKAGANYCYWLRQ